MYMSQLEDHRFMKPVDNLQPTEGGIPTVGVPSFSKPFEEPMLGGVEGHLIPCNMYSFFFMNE